MKVLITYASAGAGHFKAAQALGACLREKFPQAEVELLDVLNEEDSFFRFLYTRGYSFLVRRESFLWAASFYLTDCAWLRPVTRPIAMVLNKLNSRLFARHLIRANPDCILSTHFLSSEIAAGLKSAGKISSRVVTVVTDFVAHSFWVSPGTDAYIVASEVAARQLIGSGAEEARIHKLGIPVNPPFLQSYSRQEICRRLGLEAGKFTVMLMAGSFGLGPLEEIAVSICREAQVLVVCAGNKRLYARLKRKAYPNTTAFAFINNAHELMAVSDVIVTKPGGMTIAEITAMRLAPVFICAIPGQETGNARVLAQNGIGVSAATAEGVRQAVLNYKAHPEKLLQVKEKMRALSKGFSAEEIIRCCMPK
jgi:processive 1,2-diacylglycerol beta-glucosyltransferase